LKPVSFPCFRYFSKSEENSEEEETEVRRNLEALFSSEIETAFESVLTMERSLVSLVDDKSRSNPVLIFRDESSEMGVFELVLELALHEGYPSPLYLSAESCDTADVNQLVRNSNSRDVIKKVKHTLEA
jgi:hypothetical protein